MVYVTFKQYIPCADGEKEEEGSTACRLNTDYARILSTNYWKKKIEQEEKAVLPSKIVCTVKLEKNLL